MARKNPLVSVVIPSYNYADYVEEAVESVLSQTYDSIELIIINDGSTDNTADIIERFASRATIMNQENKGIIATRNLGVSLAKGKYIIQLDADDYLDKKYIEKCVHIAEKGADIVYTQVRHFGRVEFDSNYIEYDLEKLKHDNYIHATSLVRKDALGSEPYDTYLDKLGYEDWDVFLDLCLDGARAELINEPLLFYRKHVDRQSRADSFEGFFKETLVRHHIWSKQNDKHPDEFWYFSSQIDKLLESIHLYEANVKLESDVNEKSKIIKNLELELSIIKKYTYELEKRDLLVQSKKVAKKVKSTITKNKTQDL
jgi:glycosyltransferase involved in cell wall biosynthesis